MQKKFIEIFTDILGSVREPLVILDADLKIVKANQAFYMTFCAKQEETEGILIYDLGNGQWNIPRLRELLESILPENTVFNDFEVEHSFDVIGPKIMHLNARRIYNDFKKVELILLAIEDVTEKEHYKRNLEDMVEKRTAQLVLEKQKTEHEKALAEKALEEVEILKKQLEDERAYLKDEIKLEHNHESIIGHSDGLNTCYSRLSKLHRVIQPLWFWVRPVPVRSLWPVLFIAPATEKTGH